MAERIFHLGIAVPPEHIVERHDDACARGDRALEDKLQLDRWAYQPGLPENAVHVQSKTLAEVDRTLIRTPMPR